MEVNQGRTTAAYPHCGRTFLCNDVVGVTDIRLSTDAYQHIVENGIPFVSATSAGLNWGNVYSAGNEAPWIVSAPVVGVGSHPSGIMAANVDNPFYTSEAVGEIRPDFDGFAINLCFKFMSQYEYGRLGPTFSYTETGAGYRGQRIRIQLENKAVSAPLSVYTLVDIFVDYAWYSANVATLPAINTAINTIDLQSNARGLSVDGVNNVHLVGYLPATLLRALSCQASAYFRYEIPRASDGTPWANGNSFGPNALGVRYCVPKFEDSLNPVTGVDIGGAGILSANLSTFWTGRGIVPTGVAGGTGGTRIITTFKSEQAEPLPIMGNANEVLVYSRLRQRGSSAIGVSWPALSIMSRRVGGVLKPIVGHSGVFTENAYGSPYDQSAVFQVQVPSGALNYVMIAIVRTVAGSGAHTVSATLANEAATATLPILSTTNASGTSYRTIYQAAPLSVAMRPTSGLVERYSLTLRSRKTTPRSTQTIAPYLADGVIAFYLAFYQ